jgi:hypothetical protein
LLPFLPMLWNSMAPGYFAFAASACEFLKSMGMACIFIGFLCSIGAIISIFRGWWGSAGLFSSFGFFIFGITGLVELFHFRNPVGSGLWVLTISLASQSLLSMIRFSRNTKVKT